jgi:hypothetical protein
MREFILIALFLIGLLLMAEPVDLGVPDLYNGIYDQYSQNFVNTAMTGRGNTGVSLRDKINVSIYNPAAYKSESAHIAFEFIVKGEIKEFNKSYFYKTEEVPEPIRTRDLSGDHNLGGSWRHTDNNYTSSLPLSYVGVGFAPIYDFHWGLSYSLNKSIRYDSFAKLSKINDTYLYPTYNEHQFTVTVNRQFGDFTVGLNNILLMQSFEQYRNFGVHGDISFYEFIYRPQIGLLYELEKVQFGMSYIPKTEKTIGVNYVKLDAVYQTNLRAGVSYNITQGIRTLFDVDFDRYSETSSYFNDRITYKLGLEKESKFATVRAGYIHSPSVIDKALEYTVIDYGEIVYSHNSIEFEKNIPSQGIYDKNEMNLITIGVTLHLGNSNLHLAGLTNMTDKVQRTQVMASIEMNMGVFEGLKRK